MTNQHQPVMLKEAVAGLAIKSEGIYIDGTFGRGGHAQEILKTLGQGRLISFDKDPSAIVHAKKNFSKDKRFFIHHGSFTDLEKVTKEQNVYGKVDGILLDLGVSSIQIDDPARGFSFLHDGPLDMRMDTSKGLSAAEWIAEVAEEDLAFVLREYGEERFAKRIANAICKARELQKISTTKQLAEIVKAANPKWEKHKNPATRSFQAIRIFINSELENLVTVLMQALDVLAVGGKLVVISFHSLEDRIVKRFIQRNEKGANVPKGLPIKAAEMQGRLKKIGKAIKPADAEIEENPRARSAVLRVAEKIA